MCDLERDMTGVILVGGKSRRMGRDKAFLEVDGKPMFERVLEAFRENFSRTILVGDRQERFAGYGLPIYGDIYPGSALGGLYTGLFHAGTEHVFVSACDVPFPSSGVIRYLCSRAAGFDVVVPTLAHGFEPLFAVYSRNCLEPMKGLLESGNLCVFDFYPEVRVREVAGDELSCLDREGKSFLNLNTPEDLKCLETSLLHDHLALLTSDLDGDLVQAEDRAEDDHDGRAGSVHRFSIDIHA